MSPCASNNITTNVERPTMIQFPWFRSGSESMLSQCVKWICCRVSRTIKKAKKKDPSKTGTPFLLWSTPEPKVLLGRTIPRVPTIETGGPKPRTAGPMHIRPEPKAGVDALQRKRGKQTAQPSSAHTQPTNRIQSQHALTSKPFRCSRTVKRRDRWQHCIRSY